MSKASWKMTEDKCTFTLEAHLWTGKVEIGYHGMPEVHRMLR